MTNTSRDRNSEKMASRDGSRYVRSNKNDDGKDEDCGKLIEIFQIPSGATKLSLTQSQSSNNLIRKLLKVSGPMKMAGQSSTTKRPSFLGLTTWSLPKPPVEDRPPESGPKWTVSKSQNGSFLKLTSTLIDN